MSNTHIGAHPMIPRFIRLFCVPIFLGWIGIVVVVNVHKGGFGDVAAAPVARQILSQWFTGKPGPYKSGVSTDL